MDLCGVGDGVSTECWGMETNWIAILQQSLIDFQIQIEIALRWLTSLVENIIVWPYLMREEYTVGAVVRVVFWAMEIRTIYLLLYL